MSIKKHMVINKYILHALEGNMEDPILSDFEGSVNQETEELLKSHISKLVKSYKKRKGKFEKNNKIKEICEDMIYNRSYFVEGSQKIANLFFESRRKSGEEDCADLLVCMYSLEAETYVAILTFDHKKSYTRQVIFKDDDKNEVVLIPNLAALPASNQSLKKSAFVGISGMNDEHDLIYIDNATEKDKTTESYFVDNFLQCKMVMDDTEQTKAVKKATERFAVTSLSNDVLSANMIRDRIIDVLVNKEEITVDDIAKVLTEEKQQEFKELMNEEGIFADAEINIDKTWVQKKMKRRVLKTDTGFELKAAREDIDDGMKYTVKRNKDGSVDLVIKNVKFYEEK